MRSRFSAFVTGDEDYLLRTWDPEPRPERLELADTGIRFNKLLFTPLLVTPLCKVWSEWRVDLS